MIEKEVAMPVQVVPELVNAGVTVMVVDWGVVPVFVAVKEGILPDPAAAKPMEVFELIQLYTVPGTFPEKFTPEVEAWWHKTWFATGSAVGTGLTMMVKEVVVPVQVAPELVADGVITMVAVTGALVIFVAVNDAISPEPEAGSPIEGSELVHE